MEFSTFAPVKLLIIQTAFIGDVVLSTALIEKLRAFYPNARIDFLLRRGNESLLQTHPYIHHVWIWDKKQGKYAALWRLLKNIRAERYDWVINCQRFGASGFITAFSGAGATAGFDKNPFSKLFTHKAPHRLDAGLHETARNQGLIGHLTNSEPARPRLYPSDADYRRAAELAGSAPYVCMAPTSVWFTKQWPAEQWIELIRRIPAGVQVLLLGGKSDAEACEAIIRGAGREQVRNLAGQLSFLESAALMENSRMNYANDSAPVHIASAVNAPIAEIFCSTVPAFGFTPLSDRNYIVETLETLTCRPCGLHGYKACPHGHFRCATSIRPEQLPLP